jgi:ribonucleoside-diphosphate reductase alpha chain
MTKAKVSTVSKIRKRDGTVVAFDARKIEDAINKALVATRTGSRKLASELTVEVVERIKVAFSHGIPGVENVQDIVEKVLMAKGYHDVAKAYILYREQRADIRRLKGIIGIRDDLKLDSNALKVLERRYLLRDQEGKLIETPGELFQSIGRYPRFGR